MSVIKKHRKQLRIGMPVHTLDGEAGKISKAIIDAESRKPTYLVVKIGRLRRRREVVVPIALVSAVVAEMVRLEITYADLAGFPDYEVTVVTGKYEKPVYPIRGRTHGLYFPPDNSGYMVLRQRSVPEQSIAVERGMLLRDCTGQSVGKVEGLILDQAKRQAKYIVFRRGRFLPLQLIPAELVEAVNPGEVALRIEGQKLEKLPEYSERTMKRWSS